MLHDRRQRDLEWLGKLADRHPVLLGELRKDGATGRVGQRGEGGIQFVVSIVNHVVKYRSETGQVKGFFRIFDRCVQSAAALARKRSVGGLTKASSTK